MARRVVDPLSTLICHGPLFEKRHTHHFVEARDLLLHQSNALLEQRRSTSLTATRLQRV